MNKDSLVQFVQSLVPISTGKAEQVVEKFKERAIAKNEYLIKENTIANASYFIEEGFMRAYIFNLDGNDVTTAFYSNKMHTSDFVSFFKREPARENIQALTDCKTWYITYDDMQVSFHTIPEFREFGRANIINQYSLLKQRMLSMLQHTAEQRYSNLIRSNPEIIQNVPLKYIASYLGITDTSLSRIRKDFIKR